MSEDIDSRVHGWQRHVEYLHEHFYDTANGQCVVWVNPAQFDPFEGNALVDEIRVKLPIRHPRYDPDSGPYLVALDLARSTHADVLRESVELAWNAWSKEWLGTLSGQPIAGWVATQSDAKALAAHWATRCHVHMRGTLSKLLRFHDPSVREWLWPSLNTEQKRALLGPATSLFSIGREQVLLQHTIDAGMRASAPFPALILSEAQWKQVEDFATAHAAWLNWIAEPDALPKGRPDAGWENPVFFALSHATSYGILDWRDRELFALHVLQLGGSFHDSKQMLPVWAQTRAGASYGRAIEQVFSISVENFHTHLLLAQ